MNNNEVDWELLERFRLDDREVKPKKRITRRFDVREPKDPETLAVISQHQEKLKNFVVFSANKKLPTCPKCGNKLFFQREIRDQARLVCTIGGHSTEIIRFNTNQIWVRADFFERDF